MREAEGWRCAKCARHVARAGILAPMPRPLYESAEDRTRELVAAEAAFGPHGLSVRKLPLAYEVDFAVLRGERVIGVAEVKVRGRAYDTLMLSLHKLQALRRFASTGLLAWVLVSVPAGLYARRIDPDEPLDVRWGGRLDRGDWQDMEPVAHLPMVGMRRVS